MPCWEGQALFLQYSCPNSWHHCNYEKMLDKPQLRGILQIIDQGSRVMSGTRKAGLLVCSGHHSKLHSLGDFNIWMRQGWGRVGGGGVWKHNLPHNGAWALNAAWDPGLGSWNRERTRVEVLVKLTSSLAEVKNPLTLSIACPLKKTYKDEWA